ncbi:hypothetical protein G5I_07698 [Acromyrmex echinatior]|uniref:Uncharacterized protein n=1 Tax=Acromyrmex echinatior TaxID=103372 RepID=F4WPI3_ACREC|nr:hypothetical protein G5I_07698 [Acromyrmex echinatior]
MRSQKLQHSNADLSLISTEKLTIHRYVDTLSHYLLRAWKQACGGSLSIREKKEIKKRFVEMFLSKCELCITVPETTVFSEYTSFTQDVNETDVLEAQRP